MVSTSSASWKHNPPVNGHGPSVNGYESPVNGHVEPQYGSRLLPQVVDQLSYDDPKRVYASFPLSSDLSQGFRDVTMLEVSQAVNGFAYWLEEHFGRSTNFETISYMGVSDLRYVVVFLAVVKCGYKVNETTDAKSSYTIG